MKKEDKFYRCAKTVSKFDSERMIVKKSSSIGSLVERWKEEDSKLEEIFFFFLEKKCFIVQNY